MRRLTSTEASAYPKPRIGEDPCKINASEESVVNPPAKPVTQKRRWLGVGVMR